MPDKCTTEYDFTLVLHGIDDFDDDTLDALFEAGCDDATVAQRYGRVYVTFSREKESLLKAVISAIMDVQTAGIGATVLRVDNCNLITQAEIARRIGRTRQLIGQYITGERGPGNFPPPACNIDDGNPLWYWCEVAYWLSQNNMITSLDNKEAQTIAAINTFLEIQFLRSIAPETTEEVFAGME